MYSSYMIKYSGILKKYNNLKSDPNKLFDDDLTNTSENSNITEYIAEFSNLLNGFKKLINRQLEKQSKIEEEYYINKKNNELSTLEHFHNIKDY